MTGKSHSPSIQHTITRYHNDTARMLMRPGNSEAEVNATCYEAKAKKI